MLRTQALTNIITVMPRVTRFQSRPKRRFKARRDTGAAGIVRAIVVMFTKGQTPVWCSDLNFKEKHTVHADFLC